MEEKDRNYMEEIHTYVKEKREEGKLSIDARTLIQTAFHYDECIKREEALKVAFDTFNAEEISVLPTYFTKLEEIGDTLRNLKEEVEKALGHLFESMEHPQWLNLIAVLENKLYKDKLAIVIDSFTEEQKQDFYHLIRKKPLSEDDRKMVSYFEERLGYSFDFIEQVKGTKIESNLLPFQDYFKKYVKSYNSKVKATMRWLKEDVFPLNLHVSLLERYAKATVMRLEIGKDILNHDEKQLYQTKAINEFLELLKEQQSQKKLS